jgi:hypothetical protein
MSEECRTPAARERVGAEVRLPVMNRQKTRDGRNSFIKSSCGVCDLDEGRLVKGARTVSDVKEDAPLFFGPPASPRPGIH